MNQDQITGVLRIIVPAILSYAVGKGWLSSSQVADITAAIVTVGGVIWSFFVHSNQGKIAAVAAMPEVKSIVTTHELAKESPSEKVTNGFVVPKPPEAPAVPKTKP